MLLLQNSSFDYIHLSPLTHLLFIQNEDLKLTYGFYEIRSKWSHCACKWIHMRVILYFPFMTSSYKVEYKSSKGTPQTKSSLKPIDDWMTMTMEHSGRHKKQFWLKFVLLQRIHHENLYFNMKNTQLKYGNNKNIIYI